jgi:acetyl-CoA C-acetyltransferase
MLSATSRRSGPVPEVAIVGTGQTKHAAKRPDVNIPELVREAVDGALADAGVTFAEIDAVCFGNMDLFEGLAQNEHWLASALGAEGKPLVKLNTGGTVGTSTAIAAYYFVKAGFYRRVLAVGFEKGTRRERSRRSATRSGNGR